ncbi:MAG TPA: hypothetical protein VF858_07230 [Gemmatimonadaceae bacterium]
MKCKPGQKNVGQRVVIDLARTTIISALLIGTACTDSTGPFQPVRIVPAAPNVALQTTPQGKVLSTSFTLTNNSAYPVIWSTCSVTLEKAGMPALPPGKSDWETVWARICYLLDAVANQSASTASAISGFDDAILQPGKSVPIPISALVGQHPYENFTGEPGRYRVRVPMYIRVLGFYRVIPADQSVSEPFTLLPSP